MELCLDTTQVLLSNIRTSSDITKNIRVAIFNNYFNTKFFTGPFNNNKTPVLNDYGLHCRQMHQLSLPKSETTKMFSSTESKVHIHAL